MKGLVPGRIVHYILTDEVSTGPDAWHYAGMVTDFFSHEDNDVGIWVFPTAPETYLAVDDPTQDKTPGFYVRSLYSEDLEPGTWHFSSQEHEWYSDD